MSVQGYDIEQIPEFAKSLTWENSKVLVDGKPHKGSLVCQPWVTHTQFYWQFRLLGHVDYAVSDSPVLLGSVYEGFGTSPLYKQLLLEYETLFNNINIFLVRHPEVQENSKNGRYGTLDDWVEIDNRVLELLNANQIPYHMIQVQKDQSHVQEIIALVLASSETVP